MKNGYTRPPISEGFTSTKRSTRTPGWGDKTKARKAAQAARREEYEQCARNMLTVRQIAKLAEITTALVWHRAKKIGIKPKFASAGPGRVAFFTKEQARQIAAPPKQQPIPEGFISTKEAAKIRQVGIQRFQEWCREYNVTPREIMSDGRYCFLESDIHEGIERWRTTLEQKREQRHRLSKEFAKERKKSAIALAHDRARSQGLLLTAQVVQALGVTVLPAWKKNHPELAPKMVAGRRNYYSQDQVELFKKIKKEFHPRGGSNKRDPKDLDFGRFDSGLVRRTPLREDDWTAPKAYVERRLVLEARRYDTYTVSRQNDSDRFAKDAKAWASRGYKKPRKVYCKNCTEYKPFYDFYMDSKNCCKICRKAKSSKLKKKQPTKTLFLSAFAITIKSEISKANKKYSKIPHPILWDKIQETLGYDKDKLLEHIESQFEDWMSWENWGRTRKDSNGRHWEIDHIIPRSSCKAEEVSDPNFKKIWNLKNLRPLCAKKNIMKGAILRL